MKRNRDYYSSDSETDENVEVERESADENDNFVPLVGSISPSTTTQVQARKRRRGIIEKRRRDRINNSLSELRRLVPSALEKQVSAKLEKAEILQMTVDHLRMLHAAGGKGYFDAHALAMDYRSLGFRECLAETARYLSFMEGLNSADPLRIRLVSHLSSYVCQREVQSGLGQLAWGSFGTPLTHLAHHLLLQQKQPVQAPPCCPSSPCPPSSSSSSTPSPSELQPLSIQSDRPHTELVPLRTPLKGTISSGLPISPTAAPRLSPTMLSSIPTFPFSFSAFPLLSPSAPSTSIGKMYRPWGTEIGAF
ncbi:hypothetical protein GJAV_G00016840 [Gymnothorax javanicus]|nr:hypothetical protein GJAV_G00016840 [Gymnothorax javanicus]